MSGEVGPPTYPNSLGLFSPFQPPPPPQALQCSTHPLYPHLFASLLPAFQGLPKSKVLITRTVPSVTQPLPTLHLRTPSLTQLQGHWLLSVAETHRPHFTLRAFALAVPSAGKALPSRSLPQF